jgi:adenylosuccinate synthase
VLFEGAQGVLLDQSVGFFPYVTRSTTTFANALDLIGDRPATRMGVMRSYATRHGAGPFVTEDDSLDHAELHNAFGPWQQGWRRGHFDLVAARYAIEAVGGVDEIALTCLDQAAGLRPVCTSYGPEVDLTVPTSIPEQQRLTDALFKTEPRYEERDIAQTVSELAPIGILSHGLTAGDKHYEARHPTHDRDRRGRRRQAVRPGRSLRCAPLHVQQARG